jgi:hypothetical protein
MRLKYPYKFAIQWNIKLNLKKRQNSYNQTMEEYRASAKRKSFHDTEKESSRRGYNFQDQHQSEFSTRKLR